MSVTSVARYIAEEARRKRHLLGEEDKWEHHLSKFAHHVAKAAKAEDSKHWNNGGWAAEADHHYAQADHHEIELRKHFGHEPVDRAIDTGDYTTKRGRDSIRPK